MPVKSKKQWRWLAANRPDLLHKWQKESPRMYKKLPATEKKKKRKGKAR
jgi:hypothetical protein